MRLRLLKTVFLLLALVSIEAKAQRREICVDSLPEIKGLHLISESLISSGLPEAEAFSQLKSANVDAVICVIPPIADEVQPNLAAIYEAGLVYYSVPCDYSAPVASMESFIAAMEALEGKSKIVFCASNVRASIMLYAYNKIISGEYDSIYIREGLNLSEFLTKSTAIYDKFVQPIEEHYNIDIK